MATFLVTTEEYYPFFRLDDTRTDEFYARLADERPEEVAQFSEEEYADYQRVMAEFEAWQQKISDALP